MAEKDLYYFEAYINTRSKISKFSASIRICIVSPQSCDIFYDNVKTLLLQFNDLKTNVYATVSVNPKMVSTQLLYKVWNIIVSIPYKFLDQNNQLNRQGDTVIYKIIFQLTIGY